MVVKWNQRITTNRPIIDYSVKKHDYGRILTFLSIRKNRVCASSTENSLEQDNKQVPAVVTVGSPWVRSRGMS